jgi:hypothetical protein
MLLGYKIFHYVSNIKIRGLRAKSHEGLMMIGGLFLQCSHYFSREIILAADDVIAQSCVILLLLCDMTEKTCFSFA